MSGSGCSNMGLQEIRMRFGNLVDNAGTKTFVPHSFEQYFPSATVAANIADVKFYTSTQLELTSKELELMGYVSTTSAVITFSSWYIPFSASNNIGPASTTLSGTPTTFTLTGTGPKAVTSCPTVTPTSSSTPSSSTPAGSTSGSNTSSQAHMFTIVSTVAVTLATWAFLSL